jgi:NAD(P)-dependent dehydrogenase (short-subunit alcohol dehydrogenase family)
VIMNYTGFELTDKVAIVVGGTSGIGHAIALGLAQAGAHVVPTSRREDFVKQAVKDIERTGRKSLEVPTDVNDRATVQRLASEVMARFGRIDILVNSQGKTKKIATAELSEQDWDDVMDTNLKSVFRTCQVIGREMIRQRKGKIINIASIASFVSAHEVTAYCVSKAGVAMLTRALGCEWAPYNVHVNAIAPGVVRTPLNAHLLEMPERRDRILSRTPMGRFGDVNELVGAAIYLASEASNFTTGEILVVDGGLLARGF